MAGCLLAASPSAHALSVNLQARTKIDITTERTARGIHVRGVLTDDRGTPISSELIRVEIRGLTLPTVGTDARGRFEYFIPGQHLDPLIARHGTQLPWTIAFLGDPRYGPSQRTGTLDLGREGTRLELFVSTPTVGSSDPWTLIQGKLERAKGKPVRNAAVYLKIGRGSEQKGDTDANGIVRFRVRLADLGMYGTIAVDGRFEGDARLAATRASTSFIVRRTTRITLRVGREGDAATGRYRFSGRLIEADGPIANATVAIVAGGQQPVVQSSSPSLDAVAVAVTDADGIFITARDARELFADRQGALLLSAVYQPPDATLATCESRKVVVPIPSPPGIPVKWYFAGLLWLLAGLGAIHMARHGVLQSFIRRWRERSKGVATSETSPDVLETPFITPSSVPREIRPEFVSGTVVDAHTGRPLPRVRVSIVSLDSIDEFHTDAQGRFEFGPMRHETYSLTMDGRGYLDREVEITIPHQGYLDGGRFSLIATRRRLRELYGAALKRIGRPFTWGEETPQEAWLRAESNARAAGAHTTIGRMRELTEQAWYDVHTPTGRDVREAASLLEEVKERDKRP